MNNALVPSEGYGELLSRHMERLEDSQGTFGSWRSRLFDLSDRWRWLSWMHFTKALPSEPYPKIHFVDDHDQRARKLIESCLPWHEVGLDHLLQFLLHMIGHPQYRKLPSVIQPHHVHYWTSYFDLEAAISLERDLFGDYLAEEMGKHHRDGTGFFATPMSVAMMIAEMTLPTADLLSSVMDPCAGTGRLLLAASNHSLCLYGQDINLICIRATLVNAALFAPQILFPPPLELRMDQKQEKFVIPHDVIQRLSEEMQNGEATSCIRFSF